MGKNIQDQNQMKQTHQKIISLTKDRRTSETSNLICERSRRKLSCLRERVTILVDFFLVFLGMAQTMSSISYGTSFVYSVIILIGVLCLCFESNQHVGSDGTVLPQLRAFFMIFRNNASLTLVIT